MEGKPPPYVTSCKGSIGHLLGAAGAVESAFAALSIRHDRWAHVSLSYCPKCTLYSVVEME
jgi:3-oxoacyl-(acyl-carrier-protein) synthase